MTYQNTINVKNDSEAAILYGSHDRHLRLVRDAFRIQLVARQGLLKLEGEKEQVDTSKEVLYRLLEIVRSTGKLDLAEVEHIIIEAKCAAAGEDFQGIDTFQKGSVVKPKTEGQRKYIDAMALSSLKCGRVKKIVLARPAVEAGEKLGYLPGDIKAKVNPYLRPLYDAIADMIDVGYVKKYLESDLIEILPLAYMRGRTLNDAFIILDEAQNCTVKQMKTFLTRLGHRSKVVVTGDITQVDLSSGEISGLIDVQDRLANIDNIAFIYLTKCDIVRHKLVQDIVDAYEL
ncbi:MAG: PhoH family protein [Planctomycetes bacterium]|nr:PhoH family protein [Planctomycetota bacterium]